MTMRGWWFPAATGVAGLVAGILISGLVGAGDTVSLAPVAPEHDAVGLTTEDVRRVVREELVARDATPSRAAASSGRATPSTDRAEADAPASVSAPPPTASQTGAAKQAEAILAAAVARRVWGETDADALREIFHDMSAEQQAETLRQFAVALNQGRLNPQIERIPF